MKPVRIRPDVDPESPEYKRQLTIVVAIVVFLTITGGSCLGYRIRSMETLSADAAATQPRQRTRPNPRFTTTPQIPSNTTDNGTAAGRPAPR